MRKLLRKKPYVKEGHLYFGRGAVAKPKFDNGKICLGGGLKKRHRRRGGGHRRKQRGRGLAQIAAQLANKIAGPLLNILV